MRLAFDLTPVYDHLTGIERYNINITKEMIRNNPEDQYILLFKNEVHPSFQEIAEQPNVEYIVIPGCNKLLFIQWKLYRALQKINADYYFFLSFTSPVLFTKQRIINAIHDLTCWDCADSIPAKMKYYYRYTYRIAVKRSWKVVTVSRFSQNRICEQYGVSKETVPIIYDGLTDIFSEPPHVSSEVKGKYHLPERYMLSLSTLEPRKNLQLLIRAYSTLVEKNGGVPDLVLAGREGWKLEDVVGDISGKAKEKIRFTGFIDDRDLAQIYREAELFVFPSKYEGFGLPVIEALSQGTLVVSSDAASLPEALGNAGIVFQSDNMESLNNALESAFSLSKEQRDSYVSEGYKQSAKFSWTQEAQKLHDILK